MCSRSDFDWERGAFRSDWSRFVRFWKRTHSVLTDVQQVMLHAWETVMTQDVSHSSTRSSSSIISKYEVWICSLAVAVWRDKTQMCTELFISNTSSWTVSSVHIRLLTGLCRICLFRFWILSSLLHRFTVNIVSCTTTLDICSCQPLFCGTKVEQHGGPSWLHDDDDDVHRDCNWCCEVTVIIIIIIIIII